MNKCRNLWKQILSTWAAWDIFISDPSACISLNSSVNRCGGNWQIAGPCRSGSVLQKTRKIGRWCGPCVLRIGECSSVWGSPFPENSRNIGVSMHFEKKYLLRARGEMCSSEQWYENLRKVSLSSHSLYTYTYVIDPYSTGFLSFSFSFLLFFLWHTDRCRDVIWKWK